MNKYTKHTLAAYLASATISLSPGISASMLPPMELFPLDLVDNILDDVAEAEFSGEQKLKTLMSIATDKRPEVRAKVCDIVSGMIVASGTAALQPLLEQLAMDRDADVRAELALSLSAALEHATALERTEIIADWALSESRPMRNILVEVLKDDFFCLGIAAVVASLAEDDSPVIRRGAIAVAEARMSENPANYQQIIQKLATDARAEVRTAANAALLLLRQRNYGLFA